jgi:hypothetical protein
LKESGTSEMMDNRATCSAVPYTVDPDALPPFFIASSSVSITANAVDGCLGGPCMSQVTWELALLPTVVVEVLPDGKSPPILLGVLLPEVEEAGIVEKRFVGVDIDENTERKIMTKKTLDRMKFLSKQKKREKLDSRTSRTS